MGSVLIDFDPRSHVYKVDGRCVPSVTQVIKRAGLMNDEWYNEEACQRGKYVAEATQLMDLGTLDEDTLDPLLRPYLDAWEAFLTDSRCEVIAIEHTVFNPTYHYAGTIDRWVSWNGKETIIDIKTGQPEAWHGLQTAGYALCFTKLAMQRACVYLSDSGFKVVVHDDPQDYAAFLAAVTIEHWKRNHGVKQ